MTKEKALKIILEAAKRYRDNLINNNLLFISSDKHKRITVMETVFYSSSFLHLTGIELSKKYINKISGNKNLGKQSTANFFFNDCIDNKLTLEDFDFDANGQAVLKLDVILNVLTKNTSAKMYGEYNNSILHNLLCTEKMIGNVNFCLGFVKTGSRNIYVPNTLLKEDIRNMVSQYGRIIAIYKKETNDKTYSNIIYLAKGIDLKEYNYPKEYEYLKRLED